MILYSKRVLILDDDPDILELSKIILSGKGYDVYTSEHSNDIISQVSAVQPDVILMDNWIPDVGGIEATLTLKAHPQFKHIPVIYFSANNDVHLLAQKAGADTYLAKPFDIEALENIVEGALRKKEGLNHSQEQVA